MYKVEQWVCRRGEQGYRSKQRTRLYQSKSAYKQHAQPAGMFDWNYHDYYTERRHYKLVDVNPNVWEEII